MNASSLIIYFGMKPLEKKNLKDNSEGNGVPLFINNTKSEGNRMERRKGWDASPHSISEAVYMCFLVLDKRYTVEFIKGGKIVHFNHVFRNRVENVIDVKGTLDTVGV